MFKKSKKKRIGTVRKPWAHKEYWVPKEKKMEKDVSDFVRSHSDISSEPLVRKGRVVQRSIHEVPLTHICIRTVGERLTQLRSMSGYTLEEASRLTGISRSELSRLENEERRLTESHIARLAACYRLPVTDLKDVLSYQVKARVKVLTLMESRPSPLEVSVIHCYSSSEIRESGNMKISPIHQLCVPKDLGLSTAAYAIEVDEIDDDSILPPNSVVIADPERRVRLGDLVVNNVTWEPVFVRLERGSREQLVGRLGGREIDFSAKTSVAGFHKVILLLPGAGLFAGLPLRQENG